MNRIVLKIVFYVEVLVSVALWTATEAIGQMPPYTEPPSSTFNPKGTPCEGVLCPWGRHCTLNENNQASCVCGGGGPCYEYYPNPVCGSDNRTYMGYCALTEEACKTNSNLTVSYYSQCTHEDSLCYRVTCPSNRVCAVAGNRAICVCTQDCPYHSNPVCGSDNQTYINDCELRRKSCMTNDNITNAFYGQCKQATVCDGISCPKWMQCAVDEQGRSVCVCIEQCSYPTDIVCGSDGRTYANECELQKEVCASNTDTRIAYKGYCLEGSVCNGHRCPSNRVCNVNQYNQPVCVCNTTCSYDNTPVCGSDGVAYYNLCALKRQGCTTGKNITVARTGLCVYNEYCYGVSCTPPKSCVVDAENRTSCGCYKDCDDNYDPVCGSDNKTYDGHCQMKAAFCEANKNVTTYYYGVCSEGSNCEGTYCGSGKHCDSENQTEPMCVCDTYCPKFYNPVCGTNNKTYNNSCELQRDACFTNNYIGAMFNRRCDEGPGCTYTYCPYERSCALDERNQPMCVCPQNCYPELTEVCGTDNKTYSDDCFLKVAACLTNNTITVQHNEQCKREESPCTGVVCSSDRYCDLGTDGRPICVCNDKQCDNYATPVCGSDNRTYSSYCELQKQSCLSNSSIRWLYDGKCVEASVCDRVSCPPNKICAVDERNQPTCVCIDECPYSQSLVCGSDGRTYYGECEMQKAACLSNRNVTLVNREKCDQGRTCIDIDISCTTGRYCALNETNQPTCVCNTVCYDVNFLPAVCGTDGKTYNNSCYLKREACLTDRIIGEDYYGSCRNDSACAAVQCPTGKTCKVNSTGQPECLCITLCKFAPFGYNPVCGSDGKTYGNRCQLNMTACETNNNTTLAYDGECETDSACAVVWCPTGTSCEVNSEGQPECVCSTLCTMEYAPVCGSDGKTYGNRCQLNVTACQTNSNITEAHSGECKTDSACAAVQCPTGKVCDLNSTGQPECICNTMCTMELAPVCGSDGKTYGNRCALRLAACQTNSNITEAHRGECKSAASSNRSIHPGSVILITNFIFITVTVLLNCFTF